MIGRRLFPRSTAVSLLAAVSFALARGHDEHHGAEILAATASASFPSSSSSTAASSTITAMASVAAHSPTYFTHSPYSGLMLAHIILMTVAWVFVLPIGMLPLFPQVLKIGIII